MAAEILLPAFVVCLIAYLYYKHYTIEKKLSRFPCPLGVPILGHALDFMAGRGVLDVFMNYINNNGETARVKIGPNKQLLVTTNYKLFQILSSDVRVMEKSSDYKCFYKWLGQGLITSNGAKWKSHRRIISPTFTRDVLENFVDVFEKNAKILLKQLDELVDDASVDIYKMINLCTLDIICETAMGISVKAQENSESEYARAVKNLLDIITRRLLSPHKLFDCVYYFTKNYRDEMKLLRTLHSYTRDVIKKREISLVNAKNKKAFLDQLLHAKIAGESLSLEEIREEVDTFMFAGHDTTASAISLALFCLANHPEEQEKVFQEQTEIFGDGLLRDSTYRDLKDMKYLEMVIKECMRLYPAGPYFTRELIEDVKFEDAILPKGLTVMFFVYGLHRNPQYFPEPEKFLPQRFQSGNPLGFLPFGLGPRTCVGQKFAMLELKTVISRIVRSFELLPAKHELKIDAPIILISTNGVCVSFKRRN